MTHQLLLHYKYFPAEKFHQVHKGDTLQEQEQAV